MIFVFSVPTVVIGIGTTKFGFLGLLQHATVVELHLSLLSLVK